MRGHTHVETEPCTDLSCNNESESRTVRDEAICYDCATHGLYCAGCGGVDFADAEDWEDTDAGKLCPDCAADAKIEAALDLIEHALTTSSAHSRMITETLATWGFYTTRPVLDGRRRLSGAIAALDAALAEARQAVEDVCG